jgi:hypothetical protein
VNWDWNWQDRTGEAEVCKPKISGEGASEGPELFAADVDVGDDDDESRSQSDE